MGYTTSKFHGTIFRVIGLWDGNPPITSGLPSQRSVTRSFDVFYHLRMNKRVSKQSRRRWFETPLCSLWRLCNAPFQSYPLSCRIPVSPRLGCDHWVSTVFIVAETKWPTFRRHFQFSISFSWMKMYAFRSICHRSLYLMVKLTIFQHWFR